MRPYNIRRTEQFDRLWQDAIAAGVLDKQVDETRWLGFQRLISNDPYRFPLFEAGSERVDLRWADFITGVNLAVQIWYSIVEDDRTVYLESVEVI